MEQTKSHLNLLSIYIIKVAISVISLCTFFSNAPNQELVQYLKAKLTMSISLLSIQLHFVKRDLKGKRLFRTCSLATNLVMSLDFNPIPCVTMLCHFGLKRNDSVATHFFHFSSTATSSATIK